MTSVKKAIFNFYQLHGADVLAFQWEAGQFYPEIIIRNELGQLHSVGEDWCLGSPNVLRHYTTEETLINKH